VKPTTKAHIAVLCTNLFFAANFSFVKLISPSVIEPAALNVLRVALSIALFWMLWLFGNTPAGIKKEDIGRFVLCGITGVAINQMLFIKGLTLTSTSHASLLMLITPILVTLFAVWVLKEAFTIYKILGLALGIGGATFLILQKETSQHAPDYLLGDTLILINAISYSVYFILVKPLMKNYSPLHVIRWVFMFGLIFIIPFGWSQTMAIEWSQFDALHFLSLTTVVVTGTFLAYYFNAYGIQHIGAGKTGSYIYTQPVFAVLIAIFVLNESFSWEKALAALLIFSGVFLVNFKKSS
jgi:drug/metabolite transporter (DMT)-like permease